MLSYFSTDTTSIVDRNVFISKNVKDEIKVKTCDTVSEPYIALVYPSIY